MRVLQVNNVYRRGSTGKIVYEIHEWLTRNGIESIVCYGRGRTFDEPYVHKTSSEVAAKCNALRARITGLPYGGSVVATRRLIRMIELSRPDVVHLHCLNGNFVDVYRLLAFLKHHRIPTVLTLHAEFMYTGGCAYSVECDKWSEPTGCNRCPRLRVDIKSWFLDRSQTAWQMMKAAFDGLENAAIVSVSPWQETRAARSPILRHKRHRTVLNGIDTTATFRPRNTEELKAKHGITDERVALHVTSGIHSELKGGKYVLRLAERLASKGVLLVIAGNADRKLALPSNVIDVGRVADQDQLADYYSMADVTVLTSIRETFSMVCAESLACGTPVVGFRAGGPETISLEGYSEFVEPGDLDALEAAVLRWLDSARYSQSEMVRAASARYSSDRMCSDYLAVYKEVLDSRRRNTSR